jgi:acyl carrier protein
MALSADAKIDAKVRALIAAALEMQVDKLPAAPDVDTVERWDSLGHLAIIERVAEAFGREIPMSDAVGLTSARAIADWLSRSGKAG